MRLSTAIREGSQMRPETHFERFCWVTLQLGHEELRSDALGAACEAVQPLSAKLNWRDEDKLPASLQLLNATQQKYFQSYYIMPAVCPGARTSSVIQRGRMNDDNGEISISSERFTDLPPVTSECPKVGNVIGLADHLFHAHRWTREEVANAVELIEQMQDSRVIRPIFEHYPLRKLNGVRAA